MTFQTGMDTVSTMVFKRVLWQAFLLVIGYGVLAVPSIAAEKKDCVSAKCLEKARTVKNDESFEKDTRLARQGDAAAQLSLGLRFLMGNGVPADELKAQEWLLMSARQNNIAAQVTLATALAFESDKQDLPAAAGWFEKAAEAGNVQAMSELVRLYETGSGVTRDMAKAASWQSRARLRGQEVKLERAWKIALADKARWMKPLPKEKAGRDSNPVADIAVPDIAALKRAAQNGDDHAQVVLGALLATGEGVTRDDKAALGWFEKAADSGNVQAQAVLGELVALGWAGLKPDMAVAARWMEKAALGGSVPAEAEWGTMLMDGKGVKKDPEKGLLWLVKAAQEGDGRARLKLASMTLAQGDRESASKWFAGAADVGDLDVLSALGAFYGWGNGPVSGESEKLSEVRRYAQRDESEAQLMMGFLYGEGWGTKRDPVTAEYWFDKAAGQGDVEVWLPLGLLYAEMGRDAEAASAFGKAVELGGFSLAKDRELLQLIFVGSEKMPALGAALKHPSSSKKTARPASADAASQEGAREQKVSDADGRQTRVAKKRAFVVSEAKKGNPAAQLMMATILQQGWGVKKDAEAAASLRTAGVRGMCGALKDKAEDEPLCSADGSDGAAPGSVPVP